MNSTYQKNIKKYSPNIFVCKKCEYQAYNSKDFCKKCKKEKYIQYFCCKNCGNIVAYDGEHMVWELTENAKTIPNPDYQKS